MHFIFVVSFCPIVYDVFSGTTCTFLLVTVTLTVFVYEPSSDFIVTVAVPGFKPLILSQYTLTTSGFDDVQLKSSLVKLLGEYVHFIFVVSFVPIVYCDLSVFTLILLNNSLFLIIAFASACAIFVIIASVR